jgi:hypothetical protein
MTMTANNDGLVVCPRCGGERTHHGAVTIYQRLEGEDGRRILITRIVNEQIATSVVDAPQAGCPSSRRNGLAIVFECEHCQQHFELTLAQHKGQTLVDWRDCRVDQAPALMTAAVNRREG